MRYHKHLRDVGVATAIAHHDPQNLDAAFKTAAPPKGADKGEKWW